MNQKPFDYIDYRETGSELLVYHFYERDAEETLHFCRVFQNPYKLNEYLVDIDHCGRYGHQHSICRILTRKSKPMQVLVLGFSPIGYLLTQEICLALADQLNNYVTLSVKH